MVYTDHGQADPWLCASVIIQRTKQLRPLVALQPLDAHPVSVARAIASLAFMYDRQVYINFVSGGFPRDLEAMCDDTEHDRRYDRVVEKASILHGLLAKRTPLVFNGDFYRLNGAQIKIPVPAPLLPRFTTSGSSGAGLGVARKIGARAIQYLRPVEEYRIDDFDPSLEHGTRLGIIVRDTAEEAWSAAMRRYPHDADGTFLREYFTSISDSSWVKELTSRIDVEAPGCYWLGPYKTFKSAAPFLVGSSTDVAAQLAAYIALGIRTFLIDQPEDEQDSKRITRVFDLAREHVRHV